MGTRKTAISKDTKGILRMFRTELSPRRVYDKERGIELRIHMTGPDSMTMFHLVSSENTYQFIARSSVQKVINENGETVDEITWRLNLPGGPIPGTSVEDTKNILTEALKEFKYGYGLPENAVVMVDIQ